MGVPAGKNPTRASVGAQRTKERDISRKFLLPQQCSYLPRSHDLLGHPSRSKCKHVPKKCQRRSCDEVSFFINLPTLPPSLGDGARRGSLHASDQG